MPPPTLKDALRLALRHQQAGDLYEAEAVCREVLAGRPGQADALHLLGLTLYQAGRHEEAVGLIERAIEERPGTAEFHHNLGEVLRTTAGIAGEEGTRDPAALGRAAAAYGRAVELKPDYLQALRQLGLLQLESGRAGAAAETFARRARAAPLEAEAHFHLGLALKAQGLLDAAVEAQQEAIRLRPDAADAHNALGLVRAAQLRFPQAVEAYRQALGLAPAFADAWDNLGSALLALGRVEEAVEAWRRAVAARPDFAAAHARLGEALLLLGDAMRGWPEFEWRLRRPGAAPRHFPVPRWDGSPMGGATLLLHAEPGSGNTIQFVRFAPLATARGARVVLECDPSLWRLMRGAPGVADVAGRPPDLDGFPAYRAHLPLMSLPLVLGLTWEGLPAPAPYLAPEPALVEAWRPRVPGPPGRFNVGLAWSAGPADAPDRARSCPLRALAPLARVEGATFYALQPGTAARADAPPGLEVIDLTDGVSDFADTAALIACLDAVVTVDTAVAHLAGAMGKPVWTLLPFAADWRWLLRRPDSPWYGAMRLVRQPRLGDWPAAAARAAAELGEAARAAQGARPAYRAPRGLLSIVTPPGSGGETSSATPALTPKPGQSAAPPRMISVDPNASGAALRSAPAYPDKWFTVFPGCYGDFPHYSVRALESIARGRDLKRYCDFFAGCNACCRATLDAARNLRDRGLIDVLIESAANLNKDPMMRLLIARVRTAYFVWLDDDSYFSDDDWPAVLAGFIETEHPFESAGRLNTSARTPAVQQYLEARPWWNGARPYAGAQQQNVLFAAGGLFIARTGFVRGHDWPDRNMVRVYDDLSLAELTFQTSGRLVPLPPAVLRFCEINQGVHRGTRSTARDGWVRGGGNSKLEIRNSNQIPNSKFQ